MNDPQTDPEFLMEEAYAEADALDTRIRLQEQCSEQPQEWFAWLFEQIQLPEEGRVLELGCGPGDLWQRSPDKFPPGWQILLSDLSEGMVVEARGRIEKHSASIHYLAANSQAIPFPAHSFQAVIGNGLIDHVPERVQALGEIHRVLAEGGWFYASTGSRNHLKEIGELVRPFYPEGDFGGAAGRFGLENGERLLSPWFCEIGLVLYLDDLVFEEAGPLLEYVYSEPQVRANLSGETGQAFEEHVRRLLQKAGPLRARVEKGLFSARKRPA